jgi:hypothetical protein
MVSVKLLQKNMMAEIQGQQQHTEGSSEGEAVEKKDKEKGNA